MDNLIEAVKELRDEIVKEGGALGDAAAVLVEEVAEDHGLKAALLARKFQEQYGVAPGAYVPPAPVSAKDSIVYSPGGTALQRALREAGEWRKSYRMGPGAEELFGKTFHYLDDTYVFVCVQAGCRKWGIKAVRTSDAGRRQIPLSAWGRIAPQIGA